MKSPFWILNAALTVLLAGILILMFLMRVSLSPRKTLTPQAIAPLNKEVSKVNLARIYESDLFDTYIKPSAELPPTAPPPLRLPNPPTPKGFVSKPKTTPEFLPPLDIELKGVIFNSNSLYSRVVVAEQKTKQEKLYKIGDSILDANLIYIGRNKAIFIRSNGQQETLFITEEDAKRDPLYSGQNWGEAVEKINETEFIINADPFVKQVNNLAHLLDMLDITTAFEKGRSIGCRIGKLNGPLGLSLGLQEGDIITQINGIPTTNTTDRVKIYKEIEQKENNSRIAVTVERKGETITLHYVIRKKLLKRIPLSGLEKLPAGTPFTIDGKQIITPAQKDLEIAEQTLMQAQDNNAIAESFKKHDKKMMADYGGRSAVLRR